MLHDSDVDVDSDRRQVADRELIQLDVHYCRNRHIRLEAVGVTSLREKLSRRLRVIAESGLNFGRKRFDRFDVLLGPWQRQRGVRILFRISTIVVSSDLLRIHGHRYGLSHPDIVEGLPVNTHTEAPGVAP